MGTATDLALALDPVAFARRCGITPDDWQAAVLRSTAPQQLLLCSRQSGKSTTAAILALYTAMYEDGALILVVSPTVRQSGELYRRIREALAVLGPDAPTPGAESQLRVEFPNGSRITVVPGDAGTVRGYSQVRLLLIDEGSRLADDTYMSVRPMLATSAGGQLVCMSTPFGRRGWLYREWSEGEGWQRTRITAADCPRIDRAWLERERAAVGSWWASQEYDCAFVDSLDAVFATEHIEAALDPSVLPLFPITSSLDTLDVGVNGHARVP